MQQVSAELKKRISDKVTECVNKVNEKFGITMRPITIRYDIDSARLAGEAHSASSLVRFNPIYINTYTEDYIRHTVPHEVAHVAVHAVHGRILNGRKREVHGMHWQNMMSLFGIPADRCHTYEAPEGVKIGKPKAKHNYTCSRCQSVVVVGPKHHAALQRGEHVWHNTCGKSSRLTFVASAGRVSYAEARQLAATPKPTPQPAAAPAPVLAPAPRAVPKPPKTGSKLDQCYGWFKHYVDSVPEGWTLRQVCISTFINEVGMSNAGASTYYSNCQKMYADGR
jgi:SprT protein